MKILLNLLRVKIHLNKIKKLIKQKQLMESEQTDQIKWELL